MKRIVLLLSLLVSSSAIADLNHLLRINYTSIIPGVHYTSNLQAVKNLRAPIEEIQIFIAGNDCHLVSESFSYTTQAGGHLYVARTTARGHFAINANVHSLKWNFRSIANFESSCTVDFYANKTSTPDRSDLKLKTENFKSVLGLFRLDLEEVIGYELVSPAALDTHAVTRTLITQLNERSSPDQIQSSLEKMEISMDQLKSQFYRAHAESLNQDMLRKFNEVISAFDIIQLAN